MTGKFPAQMASNAENVSIWWRHHEMWGIVFNVTLLNFQVDNTTHKEKYVIAAGAVFPGILYKYIRQICCLRKMIKPHTRAPTFSSRLPEIVSDKSIML